PCGMTGQFRSLFSFQGTKFVSFFHRHSLSGDLYNISRSPSSMQAFFLGSFCQPNRHPSLASLPSKRRKLMYHTAANKVKAKATFF
ncbi:hypothetical protein, partial [uncultured Paenibacillus sp.]|uniref:hypothetical protein n=1 Tax=uncultured Paenibacillus sp. TaxID=227322 RepID=UPI0028D73CAC